MKLYVVQLILLVVFLMSFIALANTTVASIARDVASKLSPDTSYVVITEDWTDL